MIIVNCCDHSSNVTLKRACIVLVMQQLIKWLISFIWTHFSGLVRSYLLSAKFVKNEFPPIWWCCRGAIKLCEIKIQIHPNSKLFKFIVCFIFMSSFMTQRYVKNDQITKCREYHFTHPSFSFSNNVFYCESNKHSLVIIIWIHNLDNHKCCQP